MFQLQKQTHKENVLLTGNARRTLLIKLPLLGEYVVPNVPDLNHLRHD